MSSNCPPASSLSASPSSILTASDCQEPGWLGGSWLVIDWLLIPILPGGWMTVVGVAALSAVPVRVLVRGFGGIAHPSAATRLLVLRPFWYAMLFLPVLASAGVVGALAGALFGAAEISTLGPTPRGAFSPVSLAPSVRPSLI